MNEKEKERRWKEMVDRCKRREERVRINEEKNVVKRDWKKRSVVKSFLKDLWMLMIMLVVWIGMFGIIEIIGL